MTWFLIMKKLSFEEKNDLAEFVCQCDVCQCKTKGGYYPPEGFPLSVRNTYEEAELLAKSWGGCEIIEVIRA